MTTYYVNYASGSNSNNGTSESTPFRTLSPLESSGSVDLQPGDVVKIDPNSVVDQGSDRLYFTGVRGTEANPIVIESSDPETMARVSFTGLGSTSDGWNFPGSRYMIVRNIETYTTDDSGRWGISVSQRGSDNSAAYELLFEDMIIHDFHGNQFIGLANTRDCTVRRVEAFGGTDQGNADGFACTNGAQSYLFEDCVAHHNADDGYDLRESDGSNPSTIRGCIAYENGLNGDGIGFKSGNAGTPGGFGGTIYENCISYNNPRYGFRVSDVPGHVYNCIAWDNGEAGFYTTQSGYELRNNISNTGVNLDGGTDDTFNSWNLSLGTLSVASTDPASADFMLLPDGSPAIDAGTNVGLDFDGSAPDLGPNEYMGGSTAGSGGSGGSGGSVSASSVSVFDGSSFVIPSQIRVWNGSAWQTVQVKLYDGATWVDQLATGVVANFESGDLTAWSRDTANFAANTTLPVFDGSYSLKLTANDGTPSEIASAEGDGLGYYPQVGDRFSFRMYASDTTGRAWIGYGMSDTSMSSGYKVFVDFANGRVRFFKWDPDNAGGADYTLFDSSTVDLSPYVGQWLKIVVDWTGDGSNNHTVTVFDENGAQIHTSTASSPDVYTGRGVAIEGETTGVLAFDNFQKETQ